jgi:hypothetical protein
LGEGMAAVRHGGSIKGMADGEKAKGTYLPEA